jgi:hypothetical protein
MKGLAAAGLALAWASSAAAAAAADPPDPGCVRACRASVPDSKLSPTCALDHCCPAAGPPRVSGCWPFARWPRSYSCARQSPWGREYMPGSTFVDSVMVGTGVPRLFGVHLPPSYRFNSSSDGSSSGCVEAAAAVCEGARRASAGNCFMCTGQLQAGLGGAHLRARGLDRALRPGRSGGLHRRVPAGDGRRQPIVWVRAVTLPTAALCCETCRLPV